MKLAFVLPTCFSDLFLILIWSDWKKESKRHEIFIYTDVAYEAGHMLTPDSWPKQTQITV